MVDLSWGVRIDVPILGREAEDMRVVMSQFWGRGLRMWALLRGELFEPGCNCIQVVMSQFGGGRLRIWGLLCGSFGA